MDKIIPHPDSGLPDGLSQPALRALYSTSIFTLEQVARYTKKELLDLHGMGPKGIRLLRAALAERGLHFRDEKS